VHVSVSKSLERGNNERGENIYIYGNTSEGEGVKGETFHLRISSSKFEQFS
jgi:hypothetical protein